MARFNQPMCPICESSISNGQNIFLEESVFCLTCGTDFEVGSLRSRFARMPEPQFGEYYWYQ
jgi:hypothetical protein